MNAISEFTNRMTILESLRTAAIAMRRVGELEQEQQLLSLSESQWQRLHGLVHSVERELLSADAVLQREVRGLLRRFGSKEKFRNRLKSCDPSTTVMR